MIHQNPLRTTIPSLALPRALFSPAPTVAAPLAHLLIPVTAGCVLLAGALLSVGRLGARLHRIRQHQDPAPHDTPHRRHALNWASICCYSAAAMLLVTALLLITDSRLLGQ